MKDFNKPETYQKWSDWIQDQNKTAIEKTTAPYPDITNPQYYDEESTKGVTDTNNATVTWNGFPKRANDDFESVENPVIAIDSEFLQHYLPDFTDEEREMYENLPMRVQDEYLEWFTTKIDDKIIKIDFTCEGPEYFQHMWQYEPNVLLQLYHQYISKEVKASDLEWINNESQKHYHPYNKWNTTLGAMHLNCPPNSLEAEIQLASDATVIRNPQASANADSLIKCAQYGNAGRNSDPQIGYNVNLLAMQGNVITCNNPIGLYMQDVQTTGWYNSHKKESIPYETLIKLLNFSRGHKSPGYLKITVSIPDDLKDQFPNGFADILIDGDVLVYGGQIAKKITMQLTATYGKLPGTVKGPIEACIPPDGTTDEAKTVNAPANTLSNNCPRKLRR